MFEHGLNFGKSKYIKTMEFSKVCAKKIFLSISSLQSDITSNITDPFYKKKINVTNFRVAGATVHFVAIARFAASINCTIVSQLQRTNQICPFFLSL